MESLKKDNNPAVRKTIAIAIGNTKSEKAVPALAAACKDESWQVRKAAVTSLGNLKFQDGLAPVLNSLVDENSEVRHTASIVYTRLLAL